jgi:hypothetical protein
MSYKGLKTTVRASEREKSEKKKRSAAKVQKKPNRTTPVLSSILFPCREAMEVSTAESHSTTRILSLVHIK